MRLRQGSAIYRQPQYSRRSREHLTAGVPSFPAVTTGNRVFRIESNGLGIVNDGVPIVLDMPGGRR